MTWTLIRPEKVLETPLKIKDKTLYWKEGIRRSSNQLRTMARSSTRRASSSVQERVLFHISSGIEGGFPNSRGFSYSSNWSNCVILTPFNWSRGGSERDSKWMEILHPMTAFLYLLVWITPPFEDFLPSPTPTQFQSCIFSWENPVHILFLE